MSALNDLKFKANGSVSRNEVEKAMVRTATESSSGWHGTFAMVALAIMFVARAISDVASAVREHAAVVRHNGRMGR